jgi:geranylgeranyl diphosphate synthase type II
MSGPGFLATMAEYDSLARSAAERALPESEPYLSRPAADYLSRGGKGLRPALLMATCEAFGGRREQALPSAAALELLHTAFLVHDDVEDGSLLRRGRPTLHRLHGTALAVNAGDGLAVYALSALRDNDRVLGRRLAARIWTEFDFMARQTVEGQAREIGWEQDAVVDLTPDDYLDLIMQKTCWYTTVLPLRVGALIGSTGTVDVAPMLRFGFYLGAAFQIRDDVLNLVGSPERYGKEQLGDLREGKRTLLLIHLLAVATGSDRESVLRYLRTDRSERTGRSTAHLLDLMHKHGSIAFADEFATGIAESARESFESAFAGVAEGPAKQFVAELIPFMIERDR